MEKIWKEMTMPLILIRAELKVVEVVVEEEVMAMKIVGTMGMGMRE